MPTITVTRNNFDATIANSHIVLIDWGAQWCEPSRRFAEVFAASADQHPEIVYATVDIDAEQQLTEMSGVSVGEPEQPPTTFSYQKRAGHAAVTDRYGWPGL